MTRALDLFAALAQGFVAGLGALDDPALRAALVTAPRYITLTLAVRFLVDYLQGDRYFRVDDAEHNLRRARAQLSLVLEGILCQSLLPRATGHGRVLAMEILVPNRYTRG